MEILKNDILEEKAFDTSKRVFFISDFFDVIKTWNIENGLEDALIANTQTLQKKIT